MFNFFHKIMIQILIFDKDKFLEDKTNYLFLYFFLGFSIILLFSIEYSLYLNMSKYKPTFIFYFDLVILYLNIFISILTFISSLIIYKRNKEKFIYKNKFGLLLKFILLEFILINYGFIIIFILYLFGGIVRSRIQTLLVRPEEFSVYN